MEDDFYPTPAYNRSNRSAFAALIAEMNAADPEWDLLYNQRFHDFDFFEFVPADQLGKLVGGSSKGGGKGSSGKGSSGKGSSGKGIGKGSGSGSGSGKENDVNSRGQVSAHIERVGPQLGLVSYLLSEGGVHKLLQCVEGMLMDGMPSPVDVWVHSECLVKSYSVSNGQARITC
jgi:hypothetical protein